MSHNQFLVLCGKYLIDPAIALENDALHAALARRDDKEVERILAEDF